MKRLSEKIEWLDSVEDRRWKRLCNGTELVLVDLCGAALIGVIVVYGDGTGPHLSLLFFVAFLVLASTLLTPVFYAVALKRWHMSAISLGLVCGMGSSAVAVFLLLEPHLANA